MSVSVAETLSVGVVFVPFSSTVLLSLTRYSPSLSEGDAASQPTDVATDDDSEVVPFSNTTDNTLYSYFVPRARDALSVQEIVSPTS